MLKGLEIQEERKVIQILWVFIITVFISSCGTVAPLETIAIDQWKTYNHKTSYYCKDIDDKNSHLTIKYGSYTFTDKSAENVPTAKTVFKQVANKISQEKGFSYVEYDPSGFYESVAYNGITGVSTVLISNEILFSNNTETGDSAESTNSSLITKLQELKKAHDLGLINDSEYINSKKRILNENESIK